MLIKVYDKSNITFKGPKELYRRFLEFNHNNSFNAEDTLDFSIPYSDYKTIENEDFVEYDGIYFIVKTVEVVKDNSGKYVRVSCVHIKQLLLDKIVSTTDGETELFGKTVREVLERIIVGTPFKLGNIEDFGTWDIDLGDRTALECLNEVIENWSFENTDIIPNKAISSIKNLSISNVENEIGLTWTEEDVNWLGTKIVMNENRIPTNETDGTVIYINNIKNKHRVNPFKRTVEYNKTYYFKAFPYNDQNIYNRDGNCVSLNIAQKVVDTNPPDMVGSFTCIYDSSNKTIKINFDESNIDDYYQTIVCKKEGSMPTSESDGYLFANTQKNKYATDSFVDKKIEYGKTYYYRVYTLDIDGNINTNSKTSVINIPVPVVKDTTPPGAATISNILYNVIDNNTKAQINMNIIDPDDSDWERTKIVRNLNHYPINISDGVLIGNYTIRNSYKTSVLTDTIDYKDCTVYYKTFTYDKDGNVNNNSGTNLLEIRINKTSGCLVDKVSNVTKNAKNNSLLLRWTDPSSYWNKTKLIISYGSTIIQEEEFTTKNMYKNADYVVKLEYNKEYNIELITYDINNKTNSYSTTFRINKDDILPPENISKLNIFASDSKLYVSFKDPNNIDWNKTILCRKESDYPQNESDGIVVLTNETRDKYSSTPFIDTDVVQGKQYYYKFFTVDNTNNVNLTCDSFVVNIPVIKDIVPPGNAKNIKIVNNGKKISLTYDDPDDLDWAGTDIYVQIGKVPTIDDSGYIHRHSTSTKNNYSKNPYIYNIDYDKKYYFGVFPYDKSGNYNTNYSNVVSIVINSSGNVSSPDNAQLTVYSENGVVKIKCIDPSDYNWVGTSVYRVEI